MLRKCHLSRSRTKKGSGCAKKNKVLQIGKYFPSVFPIERLNDQIDTVVDVKRGLKGKKIGKGKMI